MPEVSQRALAGGEAERRSKRRAPAAGAVRSVARFDLRGRSIIILRLESIDAKRARPYHDARASVNEKPVDSSPRPVIVSLGPERWRVC